MHRRLFLRIAALGATAILTGVAARAAAADGVDLSATLPSDILDVLGAERVRAIGARYREIVPGERDAAALRAALHGRPPLLAGILGTAHVDPAELVRRDFAEGRTVEVHGWLLSVTEARQCALYSLAA